MLVDAPDLVDERVTPEQKKFLAKMLDLGIQFMSGTFHENDGFLNYLTLSDAKKLISEPIPRNGSSVDSLCAEVAEKVVFPSVAQHSKNYLSFPDTGNSLAGLGADVLIPFLNQNLIAMDRSAPSATLIEIQLISWLRESIGYSVKPLSKDDFMLSDVGGMWTSGGNMSNYIAILTAMNHRFPQIAKSGLASLDKKPAFLIARGIEHYSFSGCAKSLGIGEDNILWCDITPDHTSNIRSMREAIENCPEDKEIFAVVCVAGNCRTTSIDPISDIHKLCAEKGIWLHVDACHGGSLLFSKKARQELDDIQQADSVSLDPHKGMFVTYPSSYVLFKDPMVLKTYCRYPEKFHNAEILDLGLIMPFFGSRGFHSLKLWLAIKHMGLDGFSKKIESRAATNREMTEEMARLELFCFLNDNNFYRQAFVFLPNAAFNRIQHLVKSGADSAELSKVISEFTSLFAERLYTSGTVSFDEFSLIDAGNRVGLGADKKYTAMAMAIGHADISQERRAGIWREVQAAGKICESEMLDRLEQTSYSPLKKDTQNRSPASW